MSREVNLKFEKPQLFKIALISVATIIAAVCVGIAGYYLISILQNPISERLNFPDASKQTKQVITSGVEGAEEGSIHILFLGDTAFLEPQGSKIQRELNYNPLRPFKEFFDEADYVIGDHEATIDGRSVGGRLSGKAYTFSIPTESIKRYKEVGIDAFSYANNHARDYGSNGVNHTIDLLRKNGIGVFGAGKNLEEANKPLYVEIRGTTFAFFGYNSIETFYSQAKVSTPGTAGLNESYIKRNIEEAKSRADIVIVFPHWGKEHSTALTDTQITWTRKFINYGVDAIVGAHPHVRQKYEVKDGVPVAYSVGNFFFPGMSKYPNAQKGMIAEIVVENKRVKEIVFHQTQMSDSGVPSFVK